MAMCVLEAGGVGGGIWSAPGKKPAICHKKEGIIHTTFFFFFKPKTWIKMRHAKTSKVGVHIQGAEYLQNQSEEPRPEKKKKAISVLNFTSLIYAFCYLLFPNAAGIDQHKHRRQETGRSAGL